VQPLQDVCASAQGRLYGVDYVATYVDDQGNPSTFTLGGRQVNVKPRLPQYQLNGQRGTDALAYQLPPGRVAYGAAVVDTPSCDPSVPVQTDVVLNLADQSRGATGNVNAKLGKVETVVAGQVQAASIDGRVFGTGSGNELSICLDCDPQGHTVPRTSSLGPFPSVVSSWGSTFID
jgi:hypothetical protein